MEELDPFIEMQVRALGIPVIGKELFPLTGELNPDLVELGFRLSGNGLPSRDNQLGCRRHGTVAPAAASGPVCRLRTPGRVLHPLQAGPHRHGGHRLLHPRGPAATGIHGRVSVHGREYRQWLTVWRRRSEPEATNGASSA